MREHMGLFRGKRLDNGEWIEGSLVISRIEIPTKSFDSYRIQQTTCGLDEDGFADYMSGYDEEVDPDTVGECTGLTDKNGKLIFEGDIVEGHCHSAWSHRLQRCAVAYSRDGFEARNYISGLDSEYYTYRVRFSRDVVVIGTVHDNPELLKGGEE